MALAKEMVCPAPCLMGSCLGNRCLPTPAYFFFTVLSTGFSFRFSDSNHHAEKGQEPPDVHPEPPKSNEHADHDLSIAV